MLSSWLVLLAVGLARACVTSDDSNRGEFPHLHWLATLRNGTSPLNTSAKTNALGPFRRVRFAEGQEPIPITEDELLDLLKTGRRFFDVTDQDLEAHHAELQAAGAVPHSKRAIPSAPVRQTVVRPIIATLSQSNLRTYLSEITALNNRYYRATTGAQAATTLYNRASAIANAAATVSGRTITVTQFTHSWGQNSVIMRIAKSTATSSSPTTIVGAHLDTINQSNPTSGRAPGADDDGSGVVNILEAFRAISASTYVPNTPIEFHLYAAEEAGLLGSQAIAKAYTTAGGSSAKTVQAYMNLDMTAWVQTGTNPVIGLVTDRTSSSLNNLVSQLITTYLTGITPTTDYCGYACSDHASWYAVGIPTTYPFEAITETENPYIHTASDTTSYSQFSFEHMHEFSKLVVAFMIELSA